MESFHKSFEISIRGYDYLVECKVEDDKLCLQVEDRDSAKRWKGEFSQEYLHEITKKTGNYKRFSVFVKMLLTALGNTSDSVLVDLLTFQDLEMLKSRKSQKPLSASNAKGTASFGSNSKVNSKRYLILTYIVEFDRVHYPLPLVFEDTPDPQHLQRTIERLRTELQELRQLLPENTDATKILQENEHLKEELRKLEHNQTLSATPKRSAVEIDSIIKQKKQLEEENEKYKNEGNKEARKLKKLNSEMEAELKRLREEIDKIVEQLETEEEEKNQLKDIQKKVGKLKQELEDAKECENYSREELRNQQEELDKLKQSDRKQKTKIRQLENELQSTLASRSSRLRNTSPWRSPRSSFGSNSRDSSRKNTSYPTGQSNKRASPRVSNRQSPNNRQSGNRSFQRTPPSRRLSPSNRTAQRGYTPPSRRTSPNTRSSPNTRGSPNARGSRGSAYSGYGRVSSGTSARSYARSSPRRSPNARTSPSNRKKANAFDTSDIDARMNRLKELLKNASK